MPQSPAIQAMTTSRCEIAAWCIIGAVVGWLGASLYYLSLFDRHPPWHYWPHESEITIMSLIFGVFGVPIFGLYATRKDRTLFRRIVIGSITGTLLFPYLRGGLDCYWTTQVRMLLVNPFFEFRMASWAIVGEQFGAVIAISLKGVGVRGAKYPYSWRSLIVVIMEIGVFLGFIYVIQIPTL